MLGEDGDGIQGYPYALNSSNKPALVSLSIYYPKLVKDIKGSMGDVEIAANPCICKCNLDAMQDEQTNNQTVPPLGETDEFVDSVSSEGSAANQSGTSSSHSSNNDEWPYDNQEPKGHGEPKIPLECIINPKLCEVPKENAKACLALKTTPQAPYLQADGTWDLPLYAISSNNGLDIDAIKVTPVAGVGSITNGPILDAQGAQLNLANVSEGSFGIIDICGFNSKDATSGKPYECCNVRIKFGIAQDGKQKLEVLK